MTTDNERLLAEATLQLAKATAGILNALNRIAPVVDNETLNQMTRAATAATEALILIGQIDRAE